MREIRTSGSEGGDNETNRRSLPLTVNTDRAYWIARSSRAMTPRGQLTKAPYVSGMLETWSRNAGLAAIAAYQRSKFSSAGRSGTSSR
jgi:hypothetical protein